MPDADIKILKTVADVTPEILRAAEETYDGWFDNDEPIDWESFIDRLADPRGYGNAGSFDIEEYENPAVNKIKRHVRKYRAQ